MDKEIEVLLEANSRGGVIVEKDSHALGSGCCMAS